jgi:hypothetical protein
VRLRALSDDAIAGIPVVVELQIVNPKANAISTFDLNDPAIARIFWTWRSASGKTLDVRMSQYHFSVIPEPAFPRKLQVPPQGMVSRFHTVPTPLDFPSDEAWVLGVKIRDPIDQTFATAEVSYTGHTDRARSIPRSRRRPPQFSRDACSITGFRSPSSPS